MDNLQRATNHYAPGPRFQRALQFWVFAAARRQVVRTKLRDAATQFPNPNPDPNLGTGYGILLEIALRVGEGLVVLITSYCGLADSNVVDPNS